MRGLWAVAALLSAAGCLSSVHPLYFRHEKTFDPDLLGKWNLINEDGESRLMAIEKTKVDGRDGYLIRGDDPKDDVKARLVGIRGKYYIDVPQEESGGESSHMLFRFRKDEGAYVVDVLKRDFVEEYVAVHPSAVAHSTEGPFRLTAKTRALRNFVWKMDKQRKAWEPYMYLRRVGG